MNAVSIKSTAIFALMTALIGTGIFYGWGRGVDGVRNLVILLMIVRAALSLVWYSSDTGRAWRASRGKVWRPLIGVSFALRLGMFTYFGAWFMVALTIFGAMNFAIGLGKELAQDAEEIKR